MAAKSHHKKLDISSSYSATDLLGVLNQFKESVVIFDKAWRYLFINEVGWAQLKIPRDKVLGKNVWQLLPHLENSEFKKAAMKAMATQELMEIEEYYPVERTWARVRFYPTPNILMVKITNITDYKIEKQTNDQLFGDLHMAMKLYWSDRNSELREQLEKKAGYSPDM